MQMVSHHSADGSPLRRSCVLSIKQQIVAAGSDGTTRTTAYCLSRSSSILERTAGRTRD